MDELFEQFVRERTYLVGVSPKTIIFYRQAWASFRKSFTGEAITKADLINFMESVKGIKPVSVNTYARALNAFFDWAHTEEHLPECLVIPKLKEDQKSVKTVADDIRIFA